jgi:hypothetical protein
MSANIPMSLTKLTLLVLFWKRTNSVIRLKQVKAKSEENLGVQTFREAEPRGFDGPKKIATSFLF